MKFSASAFSAPFRALPLRARAAQRLFANGRELDPETAAMVSGLPQHLLQDICVTYLEGYVNRMDKRRHA
jgi:hypothetical protein